MYLILVWRLGSPHGKGAVPWDGTCPAAGCCHTTPVRTCADSGGPLFPTPPAATCHTHRRAKAAVSMAPCGLRPARTSPLLLDLQPGAEEKKKKKKKKNSPPTPTCQPPLHLLCPRGLPHPHVAGEHAGAQTTPSVSLAVRPIHDESARRRRSRCAPSFALQPWAVGRMLPAGSATHRGAAPAPCRFASPAQPHVPPLLLQTLLLPTPPPSCRLFHALTPPAAPPVAACCGAATEAAPAGPAREGRSYEIRLTLKRCMGGWVPWGQWGGPGLRGGQGVAGWN